METKDKTSSDMKIAVLTMVYNEPYNLPFWIKHYKSQCPGCELYVIDHGSDEPVKDISPDINVIRVPRSDFDERRRADMVSSLHSMLLPEFDWVLHTDCDEFVVSKDHEKLSDALINESADIDSVNAVGLNLWHNIGGDELPFDRLGAIGEQRKYAVFAKSMCKPFASRAPIHWIPGFHTSNLPPCFGIGNYFLIHTKYIDYDESNRRRALTCGLNWTDEALQKGWSSHQRINTDELSTKFHSVAKKISEGKVSEFNFQTEPKVFLQKSVKDSKGNWRSDSSFNTKVVKIPDEILCKLP